MVERFSVPAYERAKEWEIGEGASIVDLIASINTQTNRNFDPSVTQINLGVLNHEGELAMSLTLSDRKKREVGKNLLVSSKGVVLMPKLFVQGDQTSVVHEDDFSLPVPSNEISQQQEEYFLPESLWRKGTVFHKHLIDRFYSDKSSMWMAAGGVHTHPINLPPSPSDIAPLLTIDQHAPFFRVVISPSEKFAIFRGPRSPQMLKQEADAESKKHDAEIDSYRSNPKARGLSQNEWQLLLLDQYVKKHDLQFFHGGRWDLTLSKKYPYDLIKF